MPAKRYNFILSGILLSILAIFVLLIESCVQEYKNDKNAVLPKFQKVRKIRLANVRNASGITYCNDTNTIFLVQDSPAMIIEIDLNGKILRRIEIEGLKDIEGIAYLANKRFVITDEQMGTMYFISIKNDTKYIAKSDMAALNLKISNDPHHGISGITYNPGAKSLFVITEKEPKRIIEVFIGSEKQNIPWKLEKDNIKDADGIYYDSNSNHLFIVSKTSKVIIEYSLHGKKIAQMSLKKGNAKLKKGIKKAEGISMDKSGENLYICGEKNEFYIFSCKKKIKNKVF